MTSLLKQTAKIPYWLPAIVFVVSTPVAITALRNNNQHMVALRNTVYKVDKNGGDVNLALNNLRNYVYAHMNTNLSSGGDTIKPPIQLKYTYQRLQDVAQSSVDAANSQIYTDAENTCQAQIPASVSVSGSGRIACVQAYITSHGGVAAKTIPPALYEFDFVSPNWSPDTAGWSLLISVASFAIAILLFVFQKIVPRFS